MQVVVNDLIIDYFDEGAGPCLLFVHGWRDRKETFEPLIAELKKTYRCLAVDLPNFGKSQISDSVTTLDDYARFVAAFMSKLGVGTYTIVGHSMGGQIALYGSGNVVIQPERLVLLAAAGVRDKAKFSKSFLKVVAKPLKYVTTTKTKQRMYRRLGSDFDPKMSKVLKRVISEMLSTDVQAQAKLIAQPSLLIYGEQDKQTPVWMGELLHELIPHSQFITIGGENHWLHQTSASKIAEHIKGFTS